MHPELTPADALIVVDVQNDFCPGGALAIDEGDQVVPPLNAWIEAARAGGAQIVASRDWHPADHVSFKARGGPWPAHCIGGTPGAEFHPALRLPADAHIVSKGTDRQRDNYSALDGTGLTSWLQQCGIRRVWVGGLAEDVCVRATVLDACKAGFITSLILDATRPVDAQKGQQALAEMRAAGTHLASTDGKHANG